MKRESGTSESIPTAPIDKTIRQGPFIITPLVPAYRLSSPSTTVTSRNDQLSGRSGVNNNDEAAIVRVEFGPFFLQV